jgi:cephalosporin hydroxylase
MATLRPSARLTPGGGTATPSGRSCGDSADPVDRVGPGPGARPAARPDPILNRFDVFPHIEECMSMTLREWILFHNVMHRHYTRYRGRRVLKTPFDWIVLGDIVQDTLGGDGFSGGSVIIEIGAFEGGAALWMADLVRSLGLDCPVISIDLRDRTDGLSHRGIHWVWGDAARAETVGQVQSLCGGRRGLVLDDSDHKEHITSQLLELYAPFVAPGSYFIVEDTLCEFTQTPPFPGPLGAVKRFIEQHPEFIIDRTREKYVMTYNPMGYLLRSR